MVGYSPITVPPRPEDLVSHRRSIVDDPTAFKSHHYEAFLRSLIRYFGPAIADKYQVTTDIFIAPMDDNLRGYGLQLCVRPKGKEWILFQAESFDEFPSPRLRAQLALLCG
jgi:hypothetical protein